jgi:hypothetical protein
LGEVFDVSGHMDRLRLMQPGNPLPFAPAQEQSGSASVGRAGVAVADVDGEELEEAQRGPRPRQSAAGSSGPPVFLFF